MLNSIKIGTRLALGFGALLVLICVVAGIGSFQTSKINDGVADVGQSWMLSVKLLGDLRAQSNGVRRASLRHILESDKVGKDAQALTHDELIAKKIPGTLRAYEKTITSPEEQKLYQEIMSAWSAYLEQDKKLLTLSYGGAASFEEARRLATGSSAEAFMFVTKCIEEDVALNSLGADTAVAQSATNYRNVLWINAVSVAISIFAGVAAGMVITRSITRPMQQAVKLASAVAEGDLTSRIEIHGKDEAADLLRCLTRMNDNLTRIVGQVRNSSDSIATGSAQIATGNLDLSQRTEEQASNLQQTAASMEQIAGTVKNNSETAVTADEMATLACASAVKGGQVVGTVVATMREIAASSKRIADIIGVIDGIAFQTNILALNAAVEAARAGEQGRGFAVVASEVRTLASRSAEAAKEIKSLISASVDKVELGASQVNAAGASMDDIVSQVQRVTQLINEMSTATAEQATGIGQIGEAVNQLDQVTQQNAALVEESAAAADSLRHQAATLAEVVSVFKLGRAGDAQLVSRAVAAAVVARPQTAAAVPRIARGVRSKPAAQRSTAASPAAKASSQQASLATSNGPDDWETF